MLPGFEPEVLEETDRFIVRRHPDGIVTRALKEGTVRGMRASMDQYIGHPVTDRESFRALKRRYDPSAPVRYPQWWDTMVQAWRGRDYPLCLLTNGSAGLYSQLRSWCGTEEISYLFYDDPALVEEMVEFNVEFIIALTARARARHRLRLLQLLRGLRGQGRAAGVARRCSGASCCRATGASSRSSGRAASRASGSTATATHGP